MNTILKKLFEDAGPPDDVKPYVVDNCQMCYRFDVELDDDKLCEYCAGVCARGYQISYKQGRNWNGAHRDAGRVTHVRLQTEFTRFDYKALCGAFPGRLSGGWSDTVDEKPTCARCLKKLTAAEGGSDALLAP